MYDYLTARGVEPERLILEEAASNTAENFAFSAPLLEEAGVDIGTDTVAVVTNDFHVARARLIAQKMGYGATYGVGGEEGALFAASLLRMYTMYAQEKGWHMDIVSANETELGGMKECSVLVEGTGVYSRLKFESGVHRVQRVPETESGGRIHTSAATVAVLPTVEDVELDIDPKDLQIDTYRSSGAGGQHVNKTESAIRITHLPTGLVVECQDERSQYKNKDKAMRVLRSRLYEMEREKQAAQTAAARKSQVGSGDRSERIRTYNFPQGRVTDHRIGLTLYKLDAILDGDLDELIDALVTAEQAEKLKSGAEEAM